MSVQGLIFVTASENAKRISGISYVIVAIIVLAIIHYILEKIDNESGLVAQAVYDNDWYKASPKIKKALLLIMMRSHARYKIKLWFYEFNMNTYTAVSIESCPSKKLNLIFGVFHILNAAFSCMILLKSFIN